jgi:hypothetical protein
LAVYCLPASAADDLLISEVELNPAGPDAGGEKVELYNPSNNTMDVRNWTLTSTSGVPATVALSEGAAISPKGYFVAGNDVQQSVDNTGQVIELRNDSGTLIDSVGPLSDEANDDITLQRSSNGRGNWVFSTNTLGGSNDKAEALVSDTQSSSLLAPERTIQSVSPLAENSIFDNMNHNQSSQNLTITFIDVG